MKFLNYLCQLRDQRDFFPFVSSHSPLYTLVTLASECVFVIASWCPTVTLMGFPWLLDTWIYYRYIPFYNSSYVGVDWGEIFHVWQVDYPKL